MLQDGDVGRSLQWPWSGTKCAKCVIVPVCLAQSCCLGEHLEGSLSKVMCWQISAIMRALITQHMLLMLCRQNRIGADRHVHTTEWITCVILQSLV